MLLVAITEDSTQKLQPGQLIRLINGVKNAGISYAKTNLEMSNHDLGHLLSAVENGPKTHKDVDKIQVSSWVAT